MNLIPCTLTCIYQKEGVCTLDKLSEQKPTDNFYENVNNTHENSFSNSSDCYYFKLE